MTVHRPPHAPVFVVVEAPPAARSAPWDLHLHGPLDAARLDGVLDGVLDGPAARTQGAFAWRHRLLRHGPGHHTLRLTSPHGVPAELAGRIADRLTGPPDAGRPLTPAQRAALTGSTRHGHGYQAMLIEPAAPATAGGAGALRAALRTVVAAHPQLRSRLHTVDGWRTVADGPGRDAEAGLVEGEFTDEAGFAALLAAAGRTLNAHGGPQLCLLRAADRRPGGPRPDRLAVVAHDLAVDAASWPILLHDLTTALRHGPDTAAAPPPAPPAPPGAAAGAVADWVGELRQLARHAAETRHWSTIAERRLHAARPTTPGPAPGAPRDTARDTVPVPAPHLLPPGTPAPGSPTAPQPTAYGTPAPAVLTGPGAAAAGPSGTGPRRHARFTLGEEATERITRHLPERLALTAAQVLTGVFALAVARWQHGDEAVFDVCGDPRAERLGLRRQVGRLIDPYPVHLTLTPGLPPLAQLTALAGPLAASAGRAEGGAGFGACREFSPDPLLRRLLRTLPPAPVCLVLPAPGDHLPDLARPLPGGPPARPAHRVQVRARTSDGALHLHLDWTDDPAHAITGSRVAALARHLRTLLEELAAAAPPRPRPAPYPATPQQAALYRGGDARPGTAGHVEQLLWDWHGPLDLQRFTASWQSVFDRESVLRTAFTGGSDPQLVTHEQAACEITRRTVTGADWPALLEHDRLRGFDLRRPGALRLTLLHPEPGPGTRPAASCRILVTYHRALLDPASTHLLLRQFYRAYLAGGTLPGGQRRPDLRDYTAWLAAQDPGPARAFWAAHAPPPGAATTPAHLTAAPHTPTAPLPGGGTGRTRLRLDPAETARLAHWAAAFGATESSVLQTVWALLLYRARPTPTAGAVPVSFAVTVPGRGIPLDGVARMPGPLRNPLPVSVEVDPAGTVSGLLRRLRDRALDLAAYEWVPADWIHTWARRTTGLTTGTALVFEDPPHPLDGLAPALAARGLDASFPHPLPARCGPPFTLLAHHDPHGGLDLTAVYDPAVFDEDSAAALLAHSALLLRALPRSAGESTTVQHALDLLADRPVPRPAPHPEAVPGPLTLLRAARPGLEAGTVVLIPPPGAPADCYETLARTYRGPQQLLLLTRPRPGPPRTLTPPARGPVLLAGYSGSGHLACGLAQHLTAQGWPAPRTVVAGRADAEGARHLAAALAAATAPAP
ncbi:condensation domain-containing protein [Streptomyces sp. NPDC057877]|uniref:condensation domain-containing protein n=1 Tax=Streptomyces sp. NPDC057877 TaxID=3346269 RepID=UPI0036CE8A81